jgi:hypothetical protein
VGIGLPSEKTPEKTPKQIALEVLEEMPDKFPLKDYARELHNRFLEALGQPRIDNSHMSEYDMYLDVAEVAEEARRAQRNA